ncbi:hypothetical protein L7F22_067055 [Adiantum nelumboides]|nr:hypothetical protein [Adiantum nelumboides]
MPLPLTDEAIPEVEINHFSSVVVDGKEYVFMHDLEKAFGLSSMVRATKGLGQFQRMQLEGISPNVGPSVSYAYMLKDFTPGKEYIFVVDVDPQSFKVDPCKELLSSAKTIFMNAGMGSMPHFWHGTSKMDEVIDQNIATQKFFGGGDTLQEFKRWTQGMDLNGLEGGTAVTARFPRLLSEFAPHVNEIGRCMSFVVRDAVIPDDEDRTISIRMTLLPGCQLPQVLAAGEEWQLLLLLAMEMEGPIHRTVSTNGISMHYVEMGAGPVVLFLHGFPEGWYGWRNQIPAFAKAGYRAIAPDMRGYGDTSAPEGVNNYTFLHIVGDLVGLLDALQVEKVFLVTHDWGAVIGWQFALFRPDRIIALASLSVYFLARHPAGSLVQLMRAAVGEDHYICQFQAPGKIEAKIEQMTPELFFRNVFGRKLDQKLEGLSQARESVPLPEWTSEEDLAYYVSEFAKHGFTPALNYYRALDLSWELTAAWAGSKVTVPTIYIVGDQDIVYDFVGAKDYIEHGMRADVPSLKETIVLKGVQHFLQIEQPEVVNHHIFQFFQGFRV